MALWNKRAHKVFDSRNVFALQFPPKTKNKQDAYFEQLLTHDVAREIGTEEN